MNQPMNQQQGGSGEKQQPNGPKVQTREATPEEQQKYEQITREALLMISENGERYDAFMQAIEAGAPRATEAVAMIVVAMIDKAEQRAGKIEKDSVLEGVAEALITEVYNVAVEEGILDQQVMNEDVFAATYLQFAIQWAKANPDRLDQKDQKALQELIAMEQQSKGGSPQQPQQEPQQQPQQQPQPRSGGMLAQAGGVQ